MPFYRRFAPNYILGLCEKFFAACGGERFFGWRHFFRICLPGVSAASPRRIFFGVRTFFTRIRA